MDGLRPAARGGQGLADDTAARELEEGEFGLSAARWARIMEGPGDAAERRPRGTQSDVAAAALAPTDRSPSSLAAALAAAADADALADTAAAEAADRWRALSDLNAPVAVAAHGEHGPQAADVAAASDPKAAADIWRLLARQWAHPAREGLRGDAGRSGA